MPEVYCDAALNLQQCSRVRNPFLSNRAAARHDAVSLTTIHCWKKRVQPQDASSRPRYLHFALQPEIEEMVVALQCTSLSLDDLPDAMRKVLPHLCRAILYCVLVRQGLDRLQVNKK